MLASAARHRYTYQPLGIAPAQFVVAGDRIDTTDNLGLNLGYRLKRQTRLGFGVTYYTRTSTLVSFRDYEGLRAGTTVTYGF